MKLYPYNQGSASAKALAEALGIKRIKHEGKALKTEGIINWGASAFNRQIAPFQGHLFNPPGSVKKATNKLQSFNALKGHVPIPEYTESAAEALKWLAEGVTVVARQKLNGHSGEGIVILMDKNADVVKAPLYVKYIPKKEEYRVHVFRDKAFFIQQKKRKNEVPDDDVNWKVRNLKGGFIYANQGIELPQVALDAAIGSIKALGLDFGAVDIIYNEKQRKYYVLEVNTACGLAGTTLDKYVEVFKEFV